MESDSLCDAEVWKPDREKKKNTRGGKKFPMIFFLSSAKSFYIQPPSGQVFKGVSWHSHAREGEKQFSHKCFNIHLSIPQQITSNNK